MATDGMVEALVDKAKRMRKFPKMYPTEWNTAPGRMYFADDSYYELSEDPLWPKVDKLIVKALRILVDDGEREPLFALFSRLAKLASGKDEESVEFLLGVRVLSDIRLKHAFMDMISDQKNGCANGEYVIFYGHRIDRAIANVAGALAFRGLMKKRSPKHVDG